MDTASNNDTAPEKRSKPYERSTEHTRKIEESRIANRPFHYEITTPAGETLLVSNLNKYCREVGITHVGMVRVYQGKKTHHKGYTVRKIAKEVKAKVVEIKEVKIKEVKAKEARRSGPLKGFKQSAEHIKKRLENKLSKRDFDYLVTSPEGKESIVQDLRQFCIDNNLSLSGMRSAAGGFGTVHMGYRVSKTKRLQRANTLESTYLKLLRLANADNKDITASTNKHTTIYYKDYKPASHLNSYRLHSRLSNRNAVIPYHHRPRCRICSHYYLPAHFRDATCGECDLYKTMRQRVSLSPVDCMELGFSYPKALKELGLPQDKRLWTLLDNWQERDEASSIAALEKALEEILKGTV